MFKWIRKTPVWALVEAIRLSIVESRLRENGFQVVGVTSDGHGYHVDAIRNQKPYGGIHDFLVRSGIANVGSQKTAEIVSRYNDAGYDQYDLHMTSAVVELGAEGNDPMLWGRKYMTQGQFDEILVDAKISAEYVQEHDVDNDGFRFGISF